VGDPVGWTLGWAFSWRRGPGSLGQWKEAENASIDFYSFPRSDYYQTRRAELR
jgi:phospholipid-binding lipoprotein MlaA